MTSFIIAPPDAPQVYSPPPKPGPTPRLNRLDEHIIAEVRRRGIYGANVWTVLSAVALEEAPREHHEQRRMRLELLPRLRGLLRQGVLYHFGQGE